MALILAAVGIAVVWLFLANPNYGLVALLCGLVIAEASRRSLYARRLRFVRRSAPTATRRSAPRTSAPPTPRPAPGPAVRPAVPAARPLPRPLTPGMPSGHLAPPRPMWHRAGDAPAAEPRLWHRPKGAPPLSRRSPPPRRRG